MITTPCLPILKIRGFHIPSKKNRHKAWGGRLINDPEVQKVIEEITQSFVSQLSSVTQIIESGTIPTELAQSWTALLRHSKDFDDNWQWIQECFDGVLVPKGEEGCDIYIEVIQ